MGVPVTGASCVKSTPQNATAAALWVVGGTATDDSYSGMQKFNFADGSWETLSLNPMVTKDRLYHSAVYLNVWRRINGVRTALPPVRIPVVGTANEG